MKTIYFGEHRFDHEGTISVTYYPYEWDEDTQTKTKLGKPVVVVKDDGIHNRWWAWRMFCLYATFGEPIAIQRRRNGAAGTAHIWSDGTVAAWFRPGHSKLARRTQ